MKVWFCVHVCNACQLPLIFKLKTITAWLDAIKKSCTCHEQFQMFLPHWHLKMCYKNNEIYPLNTVLSVQCHTVRLCTLLYSRILEIFNINDWNSVLINQCLLCPSSWKPPFFFYHLFKSCSIIILAVPICGVQCDNSIYPYLEWDDQTVRTSTEPLLLEEANGLSCICASMWALIPSLKSYRCISVVACDGVFLFKG